jgi:hypothetical protein
MSDPFYVHHLRHSALDFAVKLAWTLNTNNDDAIQLLALLVKDLEDARRNEDGTEVVLQHIILALQEVRKN